MSDTTVTEETLKESQAELIEQVNSEFDSYVDDLNSKFSDTNKLVKIIKEKAIENEHTWKSNRLHQLEEKTKREAELQLSQERGEKVSKNLMDILMIPDVIKDELGKRKDKIKSRIGEVTGVTKLKENVSAFKAGMKPALDKLGSSVVGRMTKGIGKVFSSVLAKASIGIALIKFILSPMGMMFMGFIGAWFKNNVWLKYIKPTWDKVSSFISAIKKGWGWLNEQVTKGFEFLFNLPEIIKQKIFELQSSIAIKVVDIKNSIYEKITDMTNKIRGLIASVLESISKLPIGKKARAALLQKTEQLNTPLKAKQVEVAKQYRISDAYKNSEMGIAKQEEFSRVLAARKKREDDKTTRLKESDDKFFKTITEQNNQTQNMINQNYYTTTNQNVSPTVVNVNNDTTPEPSFSF